MHELSSDVEEQRCSKEEGLCMDHIHVVRHWLATLAYRANRVIEAAPLQYPNFSVGKGVRTPVEIVHHISDILALGYEILSPGASRRPHEQQAVATWPEEVERFYTELESLDKLVQTELEVSEHTWNRFIQGPMADVMTHVGQLVMLRRMADAPLPAQRYSIAGIEAGRFRL